MKSSHTGIMRVIKAAGYSYQGFKAAFKYEAAVRQETTLILIMGPIALLSDSTGVEKAMLISTLLLVLIVELLNSGIEAVVDRVGDEYHELSGRAKDIGSAAVFVSLVALIASWSLILGDEVLSYAFN
ncbi:diacylglycerol kinase [Marinomonas alcarazii]|uniref:Diacylglycerol kinase n=1 Tax=Marinomonas alcarazii TaxID=491949 RepID=A0A318URZ7_9GAMM|nr:diacylglycerol kinase [Marinomonas alcarazii]PYF79202.1 diacylglycerol kinase [Marinomonas alcarazii]